MRIRIIQSFSETAFVELVKQAKKELPFFLRPLFKASFLERAMEQIAPYQAETIMDEEAGSLLVCRRYRKNGKLLEVQEGWSPVADLPAEAYAVPKGLKQLRPKTIREAERLEKKLRAEQEEASKRFQPSAPGKSNHSESAPRAVTASTSSVTVEPRVLTIVTVEDATGVKP